MRRLLAALALIVSLLAATPTPGRAQDPAAPQAVPPGYYRVTWPGGLVDVWYYTGTEWVYQFTTVG